MSCEQTEVLVIGAGPAGCAAATQLARQGVHVTVVDQAVFPRPKTCGDALSSGAVSIVEQMGVSLAELPGAPVERAVAILPDGHRVRRCFGEQPGRIVPRIALDDALRRTMQRVGARLVQGVRIHELERHEERICGAAGALVQPRGRSGALRRWRADLVIAADGAGSLGWAAARRRYPQGPQLGLGATAYLQGASPRDAASSEHFFFEDLPCGYGWVFPPVAGVANVGVYQRADHYRAGGIALRSLLDRFLERLAPQLGGAELLGAARSWALPLCNPLRPLASVPGLLCCGDAGRFVDPLSGEGIWQALQSGQLAAACAHRALTEPRGLESLALRYQLACAHELGWSSLAKAGIQQGLQLLIDSGLYKHQLARQLLEWGYGGSRMEASKTTTRRN